MARMSSADPVRDSAKTATAEFLSLEAETSNPDVRV